MGKKAQVTFMAPFTIREASLKHSTGDRRLIFIHLISTVKEKPRLP